MSTERVLCRRRKARRSSSSELGAGPSVVMQRGYARYCRTGASGGVRQPLVGDRLQRAVVAQRVDRGGDVGGQRAVLREHQAELVAALAVGLRQLADDDAAGRARRRCR